MKIVHVCLCGTFGEDYAYQDNLLPKYHRLLGNDVTIIAPTYCRINTSTGEEEQSASGVKYLKDGEKLIRLRPLIDIKLNVRLHLFRGLKECLESEKPDLLFVHGLSSLNYMHCIDYAKRHQNVKLVFDNHSDWNNSYHSKLALYWDKYITNTFVAKPACRVAKIFYGVTPARCNFLHEMYGVPQNKIKYLPFGADDSELMFDKREELRKEVRQKYNIADDDFLVVTGGKIDRKKNIHLLAEAVKKINKKHIKLLIFGSVNNDMKSIFDELHCENIIMIGWVPSCDVYRYFYAADFVIFPGLHSVLWEQTLASKVPCSMTRIDGFEHVNFNDNCILLETIDANYYADIIETLYCDPAKYSLLKKNANSPLADRFRYSSIAQQVINDLDLG